MESLSNAHHPYFGIYSAHYRYRYEILHGMLLKGAGTSLLPERPSLYRIENLQFMQIGACGYPECNPLHLGGPRSVPDTMEREVVPGTRLLPIGDGLYTSLGIADGRLGPLNSNTLAESSISRR